MLQPRVRMLQRREKIPTTKTRQGQINRRAILQSHGCLEIVLSSVNDTHT